MKIVRMSKASWFKIVSDNNVIHFDPGFTGYFKNQETPLNELEQEADCIFISHFHKDHLQPEVLSKIVGRNTKIYAPVSCVERINHDIIVVKPSDEISEGNVRIKVVDAYNTLEGHSTRKVHHKGDFVGYQLTIDGKVLYHAGDTDFIPEMKAFGRVDLVFLPIGGTFVMDIEEAVMAVEAIKPVIVIPMHEAKNSREIFKKKIENHKVSKAICMEVGEAYIYE